MASAFDWGALTPTDPTIGAEPEYEDDTDQTVAAAAPPLDFAAPAAAERASSSLQRGKRPGVYPYPYPPKPWYPPQPGILPGGCIVRPPPARRQATSLWDGLLDQSVRHMPPAQAADAAFAAGLALSGRPAAAYAAFRYAAAMRAVSDGEPWADALYGCACALSLASLRYVTVVRSRRGHAAASSMRALESVPATAALDVVPPQPAERRTARQVVEGLGLDAVRYLRMAIAAGFTNLAHIESDRDLAPAREAQPGAYAHALMALRGRW